MTIILIAITILVTATAIITILKKGLNEIIIGLKAIEEQLKRANENK
tara:strand:+ start:1312 stop:1452 length:141 start_codon:yes stop_codon:yes gene_type:complete